jgi:hypothetical protein
MNVYGSVRNKKPPKYKQNILPRKKEPSLNMSESIEYVSAHVITSL